MPREQIQSFSWPGIDGIEEFAYTTSLGIQPGIAQVVTFPQVHKPDQYGTLAASDGNTPIILKNARASDIYADQSSAGTTWTVHIEDRRWTWRGKWGGFGGVNGRYNATDTRGKLRPWSIRSPKELASLLLDELGETGYRVTLPDGLDKKFGADLDRFLRLGETFPASMTNPFFNWTRTPPAEALAQLCDYFGCVIVYQPLADRVVIVPLGEGRSQLPNGPCEMVAPSITSPTAPKAVAVWGSPVRVQARFRLEPVGEDWDGSIVPIDLLTYAPKGPGATTPQKTAIKFTGPDPAADPVPAVIVTVEWNGRSVTVSCNMPHNLLDTLSCIQDGLDRAEALLPDFFVSVTADSVVIEPKNPDTEFTVSITTSWPTGSGFPTPVPSNFAGWWGVRQLQERKEPGRTWKSCPPPHFRAVQATDQLPYMEAIRLAQKSVFRYFRVRFVDPETEKAPLALPWYGPLKRVQQLTLQPTKVEQVKPAPRIAGGVNKGNPIGVTGGGQVEGQGVLPEFYNGVSRDQAATVTGSVWKRLGQVFWTLPKAGEPPDHNTKPTDRVFISGSTQQSVNGDQLYVFGDYVYAWNPQGKDAAYIEYPDLTLETACVVTDKDTDQLVRYESVRELIGGTAPAEWHGHEDLQISVVGEYEDEVVYSPGGAVQFSTRNHLKGWHHGEGDKEHADAAAQHYLKGHARKFVLTDAEQRVYIGFLGIDPDGSVQQVTWKLGSDGPTTVVSRNSEHSTVVPPYPARRRAEILPPDRAAAATNKAEQAAVDRLFPRAGGAVR